jgi:putative exporter of polyketide antibiotics
VFGSIALLVVVTAAGIGIGTLTAGGEVWTPVAGTLALGLYAAAFAGVGMAIGGLIGPGWAASAVVGLTLVTWLIDLVGGDLGIPDMIHQLALSTHMGQPMVGVWDVGGIVACIALALIGLALGTWGFARRDLKS